MKEQIIGFIYNDSDWERTVPFQKPAMRESYERMYDRAVQKYGMRIYRMSKEWYKDGAFHRAWTWKDGKWIKVRQRIKADIYYDKMSTTYQSMSFQQQFYQENRVVNAPEFDLVASDKLLTYLACGDIMTKTYVVNSTVDLKNALAKISTKKAVLKPRLGYGGAGIQITSKAQLLKKRVSGSYIVQPYVDTSGGVPGLFKGTHDFRVILANDKPVMAYIRTPAPGTELCNISLGGGICFVPVSKMPKTVKPLLRRMSEAFAVFPQKFYGADFYFQNGKPQLVEINTKPNMVYFLDNLQQEAKMHDNVLSYMQSIIQS